MNKGVFQRHQQFTIRAEAAFCDIYSFVAMNLEILNHSMSVTQQFMELHDDRIKSEITNN